MQSFSPISRTEAPESKREELNFDIKSMLVNDPPKEKNINEAKQNISHELKVKEPNYVKVRYITDNYRPKSI